jgi:hypothetical protein
MLCHGHYQHAWRLCNEKASAYAALRDHAKGRGIKFTISRDYFDGLCDAYGFFSTPKPAEFREQLSIDRVDCDKGYEPGNCRVITISENSAKSNRERHLPKSVQDHLREIREQRQAEQTAAREPF